MKKSSLKVLLLSIATSFLSGCQSWMGALALCALLPLSAIAQTDTNPPTINGGLAQIGAALKLNRTNWIVETHALYAPALPKKFGGGVGAFYPVSEHIYTGLRLDWVNGGFWMPSGSAGLKLPLQVFPWLKVTPFTYAGIGIPLSGARYGNFTVPGKSTDNNGEATAIIGAGAAIEVYRSARWNISLVGDTETWSGFAGRQYRGGIAWHCKF